MKKHRKHVLPGMARNLGVSERELRESLLDMLDKGLVEWSEPDEEGERHIVVSALGTGAWLHDTLTKAGMDVGMVVCFPGDGSPPVACDAAGEHGVDDRAEPSPTEPTRTYPSSRGNPVPRAPRRSRASTSRR